MDDYCYDSQLDSIDYKLSEQFEQLGKLTQSLEEAVSLLEQILKSLEFIQLCMETKPAIKKARKRRKK